MTIPFEKVKARLLANPKVKAEYDALVNELRGELDKGIQSLDAGEGRELNIDQFLASKRSSRPTE
jgi:hypothetical protein